MTEKNRWQVPGNGNPFDSSLEMWSYNFMSQRSIGVLQFILEHENNVSKLFFEQNITSYLETKYKHPANNSIKAHFYRPLEFIGLIRNQFNVLSVSIDGRSFLTSLLQNDFNKAKEYYILQMLKTKYPNTATKHIQLKLFPFRIMFKLLLDNQQIDKNDFFTKIPYIKDVNDIINYNNCVGEVYHKWNSWVISYLIKLNILEESNNKILLHHSTQKFLQPILENMNYEEMFFDDNNVSMVTNNISSGVKRNIALIENVIREEDYKCFINPNHITFPSPNRINYVEGHHIIPISLQKSFIQNLDCKDNIIPLCPNCHKAMHLGVSDVKIEYINIILSKPQKLTNFNMTYNDLLEIYL